MPRKSPFARVLPGFGAPKPSPGPDGGGGGDDAYLGGERPGGKAGRGSENKIPIVAAVSLNEAGHSIQARITAVNGFSSDAIADWAKSHVAPGSHVLSDGLACFRCMPCTEWDLRVAEVYGYSR